MINGETLCETHLLFTKRRLFPKRLHGNAALLSPGVSRIPTHLADTQHTTSHIRLPTFRQALNTSPERNAVVRNGNWKHLERLNPSMMNYK